MDKSELTRRLARATHSSQAEAADYLDLAVLTILKRCKRGEKVSWPGLGVFAQTEEKVPAEREKSSGSKEK